MGRKRTGLPLAVYAGECHEGAAEDDEVGEREGEAHPVHFYTEHGDYVSMWFGIILRVSNKKGKE